MQSPQSRGQIADAKSRFVDDLRREALDRSVVLPSRPEPGSPTGTMASTTSVSGSGSGSGSAPTMFISPLHTFPSLSDPHTISDSWSEPRTTTNSFHTMTDSSTLSSDACPTTTGIVTDEMALELTSGDSNTNRAFNALLSAYRIQFLFR